MSNRLLQECWPLQMPAIAKVVLVSLADRASDERAGECFPSVADTCERTCLKPRTVQKALKWLVDHGALTRERRERRNGSERSSLYRVTPERFIPAEQVALVEGAIDGPCGDISAVGQPHHVRAATFEESPGAHHVRGIAHHVRENTHHVHPLNPKNPNRTQRAGRGRGPEPTVDMVKPARKRAAERTLPEFLAICQADGEKPIPADSAPLRYAEAAQIPDEIVMLHWREFKTRNAETGKRQKDWRRAFLNSLRGNWYRLWYVAEGGRVLLSSQGRQAQAHQASVDLAAEMAVERIEQARASAAGALR